MYVVQLLQCKVSEGEQVPNENKTNPNLRQTKNSRGKVIQMKKINAMMYRVSKKSKSAKVCKNQSEAK